MMARVAEAGLEGAREDEGRRLEEAPRGVHDGLCRGKPVDLAGFWSDFGRFCSKLHQESAFLDHLTSRKAL